MHLVTTSDKRQWSTGLWWQVTPSFTGGVRSQLASLSDTSPKDSNCFAMHTAAKFKQVGFGDCEESMLKAALASKVKSLAGHLAAHKNGDWLARLSFPEGKWVIGVIAGTVVPDGDVSGSDEGCANAFSLLSGMEGWDEVFDYDIVQTEDFIAPFLSIKTQEQHRLRSVILPSYTKYIVMGLLSVAIIAGASWQYKVWSDEQAIIESQRLLAEARNAGKKAAPPVIPWQIRADNTLLMSWCERAISLSPLFVEGWQLVSVSCGDKGVERAFDYTMSASFTQLPLNADINLAMPKRAVSYYPVPGFGFYNGTVSDYAKLPSLLFDAGQHINGQLMVKWEDTKGSFTRDNKKHDWLGATWKISSKEAGAMVTLSSELPAGSFITKAKKDAISGNWDIEGISYAIK